MAIRLGRTLTEEKSPTNNKEDDFEKTLREIEPKLLKVIKETYPLAVLGLLCMAVAAFAQSNLPQATPYALTGASLFLAAFVCALLFKASKTSLMLFFVYTSAAFGTLMLFWTIEEFGKSTQTIGNVPFFLFTFFVLVSFSVSTFAISRRSRESKRGLTSFLGVVGIFASLLGMFTGPLLAIAFFMVPVGSVGVMLAALLFSVSLVVGLSTSITSAILYVKEKHMAKVTQTAE